MNRLTASLTAAALAAAVFVSSAQASTRGAFVMIAAGDTVALERFERVDARVSGVVLFKPAQLRTEYAIQLNADQSAASMTLDAWRSTDLPTAAPLQSAAAEFVGDSVITHINGGARMAFPSSAGAVPYLNPSMLLFEQVARRGLAMRRESAGVPMFMVAGGKTIEAVVTRASADTVVLSLGGLEIRLAMNAAGDVTGGAIPAQGVRIMRAESLPEGLLVSAKPDYSAPAGAPYTSESVRVRTSEGFELAGTLTKPKGSSGRIPAVVTITGSGSSDRDEAIPFVRGYRPFREVAEALAARGIATLRLDDRGYGESGGNAVRATSEDFAHDVEAAVKFLRARSDIDGARLALVGHSEGGLIAPMVAARDPKLRGIVLLAGPAYDGARIISYQQRTMLERGGAKGAALDSLAAVAAAETDSASRANPWLSWFRKHDPLVVARALRGTPVLVLQGATDRQVTAEQAEILGKAFGEAGNRDVTVRVFPETNHLFLADPNGWGDGYSSLPDTHVRREVLDAIGEWLAPRLKK